MGPSVARMGVREPASHGLAVLSVLIRDRVEVAGQHTQGSGVGADAVGDAAGLGDAPVGVRLVEVHLRKHEAQRRRLVADETVGLGPVVGLARELVARDDGPPRQVDPGHGEEHVGYADGDGGEPLVDGHGAILPPTRLDSATAPGGVGVPDGR